MAGSAINPNELLGKLQKSAEYIQAIVREAQEIVGAVLGRLPYARLAGLHAGRSPPSWRGAAEAFRQPRIFRLSFFGFPRTGRG